MEKEIRSTIYLTEQRYKRFREACNKKFGDKQGKIKQGINLAIDNFCNETLQDVTEETKSTTNTPPNSAKKLNQASSVKPTPPPSPRQQIADEMLQHEAEASVRLDQDSDLKTITESDIEAKAKKLAEERRKKESKEHQVLT